MMYEKEFQAFTFTAHQAVNIQLAEKVCFFKKVLVLNPYPQTPFPRKGAECGAAALTPLGATPKARMLWLLAKSFARCKTNRASNTKHPFLTTIKVFRQTEYYVLVLGGYYINCSVSLLRFVAGLRNQAKYDKINSDIKQDLRII